MRDLHSTVAACNTDSIVVPCDATGSSFACAGAQGGMLRHLTPEELQGILDSFEPLGIRWKIEVAPTQALVIGTNKVIFGHQEADGSWVLDRSCDTNLGGHKADPSDSPGALLPDGHWVWGADVLTALLAACTSSAAIEVDQRLPLPDDLPDWACNRPILSRHRATRWSALLHLRDALGDQGIGPFATYLRCDTGGDGPSPVAQGPGWDPDTWSDRDWRVRGERVGVEVLTPTGLRFVGGYPHGRRVVVRSVADYFAHWLAPECDPSFEGPTRGLRRVVPVRSSASATRVVGRHGEALLAVYEDPETPVAQLDQLDYGTILPSLGELRERARKAGMREVSRRSSVPERSVSDWVNGAASSENLVVAVAMALDEINAEPVRICALEGCDEPASGRHGKWCGGAHRALGSRVARGLVGLGTPRRTWADEAAKDRVKGHRDDP
jgi:hypothetical protein